MRIDLPNIYRDNIVRAEDSIFKSFGDRVSAAAKGKSLNKYGIATVGTTPRTVMGLQGSEINETFLTTNGITHAVSTNAGDVGKRCIIEGNTIDAFGNLTVVVQTVILNGTTPVALEYPLARANRAILPGTGTFGDTPTVAAILAQTLHETMPKSVFDGRGTEGQHWIAAILAHEVNRIWCRMLGDFSQPAWPDAPEWQKESALQGVLFHMEHPDAGPSGSHENWRTHKEADGWTWGPVKDPEKKEHPCMVPFSELPLEQQVKDSLFRAVVHSIMGNDF